MIRRIEADAADLTEQDQALIADAVTVVRKTRQRVHQALADMPADGSEVSVSAVADRAHGSGRQSTGTPTCTPPCSPPPTPRPPAPASTAISHRSVLAENANLHQQNRRLAQQVSDLEQRLSELLGQPSTAAAWALPRAPRRPTQNWRPSARPS